MIELHPLVAGARRSTRIERFGFERTGPGVGTLALEFGDGALWYYAGVPEKVLEGLLLAESKGRYFDAQIRPHYRGVTADEAGRRQSGA